MPFQPVKISVRKPSKIIVPFADARQWRAGGDYLFQIKMDGFFHVEQLDGFVFACEQMRDGTRYAHTLLAVPGQCLQSVKLRETMPELRRIVAQPRFQAVKIRLCPEFSGGEGLEALFAAGHEGGVAKYLDAPPGTMYACKRTEVFYCRVTALDHGTGGVWLADRDTNEPRGKVPLRGDKFGQIREGSILKIEAFGLTARGLLREARPDKDSTGSWLVRF